MLLKSESHFIPKLTTLLLYLHLLSLHFLCKNNSSAANRRNLKVLPKTYCIWMPFILLKIKIIIKKNTCIRLMVSPLPIWVQKLSLALRTSMPMASKSVAMYCRMISTHGRWMGSSWLSWTLTFRMENTSLHRVFVSALTSNFRGETLVLNKGVWKRRHNLF